MNRSTRISLVVALLILLLGIGGFAWRGGWFDWKSRAQVASMKAQLAENIKEESFDKRREKMEQMRAQFASLPAQFQKQFQQTARQMMVGEMNRRLDEFFEMNPTEQRAELDKRIRQMEEGRKRWQQQSQQAASGGNGGASSGANGGIGNASGSGNGPSPGGPPSPGNGPPPGGPGGMFGGPGGLSGMLDATSPESRAKFAEAIRLMQKRRQELGLPPMPGPGGPR